MILTPETWVAKGNWRVTTDSTSVKFNCVIQIEEETAGTSIHVQEIVRVDDPAAMASQFKYDAWIVPDETGLYTIRVDSKQLTLEGVGKLESLPHLATLRSEDGETHVTLTLFEMPEVYGVRAFITQGEHTYTFELALWTRAATRIATQKKSGDATIIPFNPRGRRR